MEDYPKDSYRIRVGDWDMDVSNSFKKFISSRKIFDFSILFIL